MDHPLRGLTHDDYTVAYICPMGVELAPVKATLDERHLNLSTSRDINSYTLGRIGEHNVVIAVMPEIGNNKAATVATQLLNDFRSIRFGLLVGIGGGIPWVDEYDIRLGDVVVSKPTETFGGVVQFDSGRSHSSGRFERTGVLVKPPPMLQACVESLRAEHDLTGNQISQYLTEMFKRYPIMEEKYGYPGIEYDQLFESSYNHKDGNTCRSCDQSNVVDRNLRKSTAPRIHYGTIGSSNLVIKDGNTREQLKEDLGILCVEMEAAGLMDEFSCLVIRGICDYADSHKNKRWQPYAAATAAAYAKEILCAIPPQSFPTITKAMSTLTVSKAHWLVPFGRNINFTGRDNELQELIEKLDLEGPEDGCRRIAIVGLGGVGKTQIALEAAFRIQKTSLHCSVFWISAASVTTFERAFRDIGQALQILVSNESESDVKSLVKKFLSQEHAGRWLLIIDNADDIEMLYNRKKESDESSGSPALADYLPSSRKGMILFTTRNLKAAVKQAEANVIIVKEMNESDSWKLLQTSLIDKSSMGAQDTTAKLLDNLTYLPLAIKQAAAYMNENTVSVSDYLRLYEESDEDLVRLLSADFEDQGRYREVKNAIASTWLISFRQISSCDQLAEKYLCFMSCIAQQDIPRSILPPATKSKELEAIGTLRAYSLIIKRDGQDSYDIHRLVQIAMRNWLKSKGELGLWSGIVLSRVSNVFPYPEYENRSQWTVYLPHAQIILGFQGYISDFEKPQEDLLFKLGRCFHINGKYIDSAEMYYKTLELDKKILGPEHPDTLTSMNNLGRALSSQGKFVEAEEMHRQTLKLDKKISGPEHPHTLVSMNQLASALMGQGKFVEAEELQRQALELRRRVLGLEHPHTLTSMSDLASAMSLRGNFIEAEELQRQALELRKAMSGAEHPDTLTSMSDLATTLAEQGKYVEAEEMHRQTLELDKKVSGPEHPHTLTSMSELASALSGQGKYIEAEELQRQALELRRRVLGLENPYTLTSMSNLAKALIGQSKYTEAEDLYRQTLGLRMKVLGQNHPSTLKSVKNLVKVLREQGKFDEAERTRDAHKAQQPNTSAV